uniref:protein ALP1-like n=1 Tax=Styela clava TaxID=7725 RepID=UPI00193A3FD9|nr:protein ALP1-like [Styela clava]
MDLSQVLPTLITIRMMQLIMLFLMNERFKLCQVMLRRSRLNFLKKVYCICTPTKKRRRKRRFWKKTRTSEWWDRIVNQHFGNEDWIENFRVSWSTFQYIVEQVRPYMSPKQNWVRPPLPVEKRVAVALYKLASCCEYRVVANIFGIAKCTVHACVYQFCRVFTDYIAKQHIAFPSDIEAIEISERIFKVHSFPHVYGAIDGTHIPILPPKTGYRDFTNRKGWPSIILQAVVDDRCIFRDISCSMPGSVHDATVLKNSSLYKLAVAGSLPSTIKRIQNCDVPLMILGDPAYPLQTWLMKGYSGSLNPSEESFNVYLSSARNVVEHAFGRLKSRWRCLSKRCDISYKFMPKVVATCCVLHNICEKRKDVFLGRWSNETYVAQPQPERRSAASNCSEAVQNREALRIFLEENFSLRKSSL